MVVEKFPIHGVKITEKYTLPQVLITTPDRRKLCTPTKQRFL